MGDLSVFSDGGIFESIFRRKSDIDSWFAEKFTKFPAIPCVSIDVRNSGYKVAPVDINAFPAGFNNLNESSISVASERFGKFLPKNQNIVILPENYTRNLRYLDNLIVLKNILEEGTGAAVEIAHPSVDLHTLQSYSGKPVEIHSLIRDGDLVKTGTGFVPDMILINNDMTNDAMSILNGVKQQIIPDLSLGWTVRSKGRCFDAYSRVVREFCRIFGFDPWVLTPSTVEISDVNFSNKQKLECLAGEVDKMVSAISSEYAARNISSQPYVFLKASNGTYGMGVMSLSSGSEVVNINKQDRKKMSVIKGRQSVNRVVLQEGIATVDSINGYYAESLLYSVFGKVCGYLYRYHTDRDDQQSLNSIGANFVDETKDLSQMQHFILSLIGQMSCLSVAVEVHEHKIGPSGF